MFSLWWATGGGGSIRSLWSHTTRQNTQTHLQSSDNMSLLKHTSHFIMNQKRSRSRKQNKEKEISNILWFFVLFPRSGYGRGYFLLWRLDGDKKGHTTKHPSWALPQLQRTDERHHTEDKQGTSLGKLFRPRPLDSCGSKKVGSV